jgi:GIY-YIG catalytic domain-containing protein
MCAPTTQQLHQFMDQLLNTAPLFNWVQLSHSNILPPRNIGTYGWWFPDGALPGVPSQNCVHRQGLYLGYVGIAAPQTLHTRIRTNHFHGKASNSILRTTLGLLLEHAIGTVPITASPRRQGTRPTTWNFGTAETNLSNWIMINAAVNWVQIDCPEILERFLIRNIDLPLNSKHNSSHPFYHTLKRLRRSADQRTAPLTNRRCSNCGMVVTQRSWGIRPKGQYGRCAQSAKSRHKWMIVP